jgi:hypothetical protein
VILTAATFFLGMALSAECGPLALVAEDCHREARIWAAAGAASAIEWVVPPRPEAA